MGKKWVLGPGTMQVKKMGQKLELFRLIKSYPKAKNVKKM